MARLKLYTVVVQYSPNGKEYSFATRSIYNSLDGIKAYHLCNRNICGVKDKNGELQEVKIIKILDGLVEGVKKFRLGNPVTSEVVEEAKSKDRYLNKDGSVWREDMNIGMKISINAEAIQKALKEVPVRDNAGAESVGLLILADGRMYIHNAYGSSPKYKVNKEYLERAVNYAIEEGGDKRELRQNIARMEQELAAMKAKLG